MHASVVLVYFVVAVTVVSCIAQNRRWWNFPRPKLNLQTVHCDIVEQSGLCRCCPSNPCDYVKCLNGGQCVGDGVCECVCGFNGPTCNISPCDNVECLNGGQCVGEGVCNCISGFSGPTCNISPCDNVECLNGGQCVGEGVCNCISGFGGANCDMRVCNGTECYNDDRQGICILPRCIANVTDCGGNICDTNNDEVCVGDTCVIDKSQNCGKILDHVRIDCGALGDPCGEGKFCPSGSTKCLNDTCRVVMTCGGQPYGNTCSIFGSTGTCSDGVCLVPCVEDIECFGRPCIGGYCAYVKCGESFCQV
ncbi:sushi, nidogen and EGF-like domain-containing protein 1 [Patella vulgata]|uniref:sushi, nidogen and EGF-like domain-containing protein 1 n=1 Tax=Patella vulgata TaxID=6465 RepID=UPI00218058D2|nr:sushi, nidogen and EGF-like domain-containing protein 1 [Patella vulgata]